MGTGAKTGQGTLTSLVAPDLHWLDLGAVNAYLWTGPGGPTLIDTGLPNSVDKLIAMMQRAGVQVGDLQEIIITHADIDHVGGLKQLVSQKSARVSCHTVESALVKGKSSKKPNPSVLGFLIRPGVWLSQRIFKPGVDHVDDYLLDGQTLANGFTVLHMPGHSPGQIAMHHADRGIMIAADALQNRGGKLSLPPTIFTPSVAQAKESLQKLLKLKYEVACFGHGPPITHGADAAIAAFVQALAP